MRKTKIICTVGPSTSTPETLKALVDAGMNVARLNFSHGDYQFHGKTIEILRSIPTPPEKPLALMQDLCGPKIRLGMLPDEGLMVEEGEEVTFVGQEKGNNIDELPLPIPTLFAIDISGKHFHIVKITQNLTPLPPFPMREVGF